MIKNQMISHKQLSEYIIRPSLNAIGMYSLAVEQLLLGTAAKESQLGYYIHQIGKGPALGLYQMEPKTFNCIIDNWLNYRRELSKTICDLFNISSLGQLKKMVNNLMWDMRLSTIMARLHYRRVAESLPSTNDIDGMARYWKKYYNTHLGAHSFDEAIKQYCEAYDKYIGEINE